MNKTMLTQPLTGVELQDKVNQLGNLSKEEKAKACGYVTITKKGVPRVNMMKFLNALIDAEGIDAGYAPILSCSGLTSYSAVRKLMPFGADDWIVVMGAGGLGLMAIAILRALGHSNIAVCEVERSKWEAARETGAASCFDPRDSESLSALQALAGGKCRSSSTDRSM